MSDNRDSFNHDVSTIKLDSMYYIDRIDLLVNDLSVYRPVMALVENTEGDKKFHRAKLTQKYELTSKYRNPCISRHAVGFNMEVSFPRREFLVELADILIHADYTISWLEIAYDIKTPSKKVTHNLIDRISEIMVIPSIKKRPTFWHGGKISYYSGKLPIDSIYFGAIIDPKIFKIYIPHETGKVFGKTSFHSEFRLEGVDAVRSYGIWTLHDLVYLDYQEWYKEHVKVFRVNKTDAGATYMRINNMPDAGSRQNQKDFRK